MQAINYIRQGFKSGNTDDSNELLLSKMLEQQVSCLPVINSDNELEYVVSLEDVKQNIPFERNQEPAIYSLKNQHIIEVIELITSNSLDCLPIIDENKKYRGSITLLEIAKYISSETGYKFPGAVIILEVNYQDYSLVEISGIVESNGAKILNASISQKEDSSNMFVTLKINTKETSSILQAFRRYNYNIHSHYLGQDIMERFYHNRINEFMKYMNM